MDYNSGRIVYWGDAKFDEQNRDRNLSDFTGNKILLGIHDLILKQKKKFVPPILHFSKNKKVENYQGVLYR